MHEAAPVHEPAPASDVLVDGILPPRHGFDAESSKEVLSIESKFLEELRQSTSHLRTSFGMFKEMQNAHCKPFEDEASVVVRQI